MAIELTIIGRPRAKPNTVNARKVDRGHPLREVGCDTVRKSPLCFVDKDKNLVISFDVHSQIFRSILDSSNKTFVVCLNFEIMSSYLSISR